VVISILTKYEFRQQLKKMWSHLASIGKLEWQILAKTIMADDLSYLNYKLEVKDETSSIYKRQKLKSHE
jgi:phosphate uptake regulator